MDALWETMMQTCPILMREWIGCFRGDEEAARREIRATLTDYDRWKDRASNFLLRLVSDDNAGGYRDARGNCKPRVQLALGFVRQMSADSRFSDFVLATLNARAAGQGNEVRIRGVSIPGWLGEQSPTFLKVGVERLVISTNLLRLGRHIVA